MFSLSLAHSQRSDPFHGNTSGRSYKEIMKEKALDDEEAKVYQQILEKQRADDEARAVLFFLSPLSRPGPQTRPP